ncbi:MAG: holo-ACP synthase [Woeseiaceae bacterium]|jgi:holo-[acyl-carrier protein] synthase|nr:holo-ACP synthase [Woeseiaceae bacterium]|tara:strand:- start:93 stop:488 length:396 start_codon:yes stop_codon:yes gene_type:complete
MIFGVGTDLVELSRIQATYERFGDHFVDRLLMDEERVLFEKNKMPVRFLAMRFAAKEATVKAMGTGFAQGIWIRDVGVVNNEWGKPDIIWSARGQRLCTKLGIGEGHVSLTDDAGLILAFAVVMRENQSIN